MTPEEKADLLQDCDLLAPAGDATTTRLNGGSIRRVVKAARAYAEIAASQQCAARKQGTAGGNDPADCDWPVCGCDPHANKVIDALLESGYLVMPPAPAVAQDGVDDSAIDAARQRYLGAIPIYGASRVVERIGLWAAIAPLLAENAELETAIEALDQKIKSLAPHETCGCSYDRPGDVCMHHSPALAHAEADANRLAEALRWALSNLTQFGVHELQHTNHHILAALAEHDKASAQR